jgi:hypothetical protein
MRRVVNRCVMVRVFLSFGYEDVLSFNFPYGLRRENMQ